ncbi:MAG: DNA polymerase III subunit gamma/tau [Pirellulales bacterium]|nr:DNA polymerase III subunit gamma/tau [Pirellulales bacterium]
MSEPTTPPETKPTPSMGRYTVIARRYRPQSFDELVGQEHAARALQQAIASDRVGHAYLFTGARGVGKTSAARILAKALNCVQGPTPAPCNECDVCRRVTSGDDVDVLEIDGASNRGIDEIRQLRQNVAVRPSRVRYKIYIIDEVHMLTKEAFNALLKTLEEPPEHVKFIFATTEPQKIPITILSRCQRFDFAGISAASIQERLAQIAAAEGVAVDADALQILACRAAGSMRDSQSLLEQLLAIGGERITAADVNNLLGTAPAERLGGLVRHLANCDAPAALAELDAMILGGVEPGLLLDQLVGYFRDVMAMTVGCPPEAMLYALPSQAGEVAEIGQRLGLATVLAIGQVLDHTSARMRVSMHGRTLVEMAVVRICQLGELEDLAALVAELRGEAAVPRGAAPPTGGRPAAEASKKNDDSTDVSPSAAGGLASAVASMLANEPPRAASPTPLTPPTPVTSPTLPTPPTLATRAASSAPPPPLSPSPVVAESPVAPTAPFGALAPAVLAPGSPAQPPSRSSGGASTNGAAARQPSVAPPEEPAAPAISVLAQYQQYQQAMVSGGAPQVEAPAPRKTRREQQAEVAEQPFVRRAMELFDAQPGQFRYFPPEGKANS